jgi:hypothetical protein
MDGPVYTLTLRPGLVAVVADELITNDGPEA